MQVIIYLEISQIEIFYLFLPNIQPMNPSHSTVYSIGTIKARISSLMDSLLRLYAISTFTCIRDIIDFIRLKYIGNLPNIIVSATMLLSHHHHNNHHKHDFQVIRNIINDISTTHLIISLWDLVLIHNYFIFCNKIYLQISSIVMCMLGFAICRHFYGWSKFFLSNYPVKLFLYLRFIDNIFIICSHRKKLSLNSKKTSRTFSLPSNLLQTIYRTSPLFWCTGKTT